MNKFILSVLITLSFAFNAKSQATCSGSYTFGSGDCNPIQIGDGTAGTIEICITVNTIASGGGSSCNPGGACNPPYNGGGHAAGLRIYASSGAGSTGTLETNWTSASGLGCYIMSTATGYAYIYGLCDIDGTTITWETLDPCGFNLCSGPAPPCAFPCATCAAPCGTAQGFSTNPTVAEVVAGCTTIPFIPELAASSTNTFCFDFQATNTTVDFNVIITSNCGIGNTVGLTWELFDIACGAAVQTGTIAGLTFTPVVVGNDYVFCYTFDVPSHCTHSQHCPFFVGAIVLPVELTDFRAKTVDNSIVELDWKTKSERENDFFTIERSPTGIEFEAIGTMDGAGNSSMDIDYKFKDVAPISGMSYYRLKQTDFDGTEKYSNIISVEIKSSFADLDIYPNPVKNNSFITFNSTIEGNVSVSIYDIAGSKVLDVKHSVEKGDNKLELQTNRLPKGMYFIALENEKETSKIKFIKD